MKSLIIKWKVEYLAHYYNYFETVLMLKKLAWYTLLCENIIFLIFHLKCSQKSLVVYSGEITKGSDDNICVKNVFYRNNFPLNVSEVAIFKLNILNSSTFDILHPLKPFLNFNIYVRNDT